MANSNFVCCHPDRSTEIFQFVTEFILSENTVSSIPHHHQYMFYFEIVLSSKPRARQKVLPKTALGLKSFEAKIEAQIYS